MCLSQPEAVNKVHVMPDILPCAGAECRVKNPRELVYTTTTTTTTRAAGWLEWTEWSDCSATCGSGQISRSRVCFSYSGNESLVCGGYTGSDELDVRECTLDACTSGVEMVTSVTSKAHESCLEDNLFLSRYAQSVTLNGATINANGSSSLGYGTWRLTATQLNETLLSTTQHDNDCLTDNLITNVNVSAKTLTSMLKLLTVRV